MYRKTSAGFARQGFTLIELLIVVAIIAILAAIAVPNFLEAQTRSKVSRVKSDLRSLATAQEAYRIDWNSYTFKDTGDNAAGYYVEGFADLTSPIAYIGSVPWDAFGQYMDLAVYRKPMLEMGTGNAGRYASSNLKKNPNRNGIPINHWMMRSTGPDRVDETTINTYPWNKSVIPHNAAGEAKMMNMVYDPTNGTVSHGDIYRVGGEQPGGSPWTIFFALASK